MTDSYDGTRGHSGGDASKDAAIAERDKGKTSEMMDRVLGEIERAGERGLTVIDLRESWELAGEHHGRISSALTKLHIAGKVVALRERRNNCGVYVLTGREGDRDVRPYRRQNVKLQVDDVVALMDQHRSHYITGTCACGVRTPGREERERHLAQEIVALSRGEL